MWVLDEEKMRRRLWYPLMCSYDNWHGRGAKARRGSAARISTEFDRKFRQLAKVDPAS